jgi:mycothiol synthase
MSETIRRFESRDLPGVLRVLGEAMHADAISEARFTRQVLLDHNFRAAGAPLAVQDDQVIGFCLSIARQTPLENAPSDVDRGYITLLAVSPAHQRRGVGTKLLAAAEDYLRGQGKSVAMISSYAPGYFIPGVDVNAYAGGLEFLKKHGYVEVYRPLAMQTSLSDLNVPVWVQERRERLASEGVTISPYSPELTLPLLDFARKEFPGDWVRVVRGS